MSHNIAPPVDPRALVGDLLACIRDRRTSDPAIATARAFVATAPAASAPGFVMVPVEPTAEMLEQISLVQGFSDRALRARYTALLAAASKVASLDGAAQAGSGGGAGMMTEEDKANLGWSIPANLRWLAEQPERPGYTPCGALTGRFLADAAAALEAAVSRATSAPATAPASTFLPICEDATCNGNPCVTPPASTSAAIAAGENAVERIAKALGLARYPGGTGGWRPTRWPTGPDDLDLRESDGTVPLTWDFAEQCRAEARIMLEAAAPKAASEDGATGEVIERLKSMISPSGRLAFTAAALDKIGARELQTVKLAIAACEAAQFLSDRLGELEWIEDDMAATCRGYFGHVDPAHYRLRVALAEHPAAAANEGAA